MRSNELNSLFYDIKTLKGVGPKLQDSLNRLCGNRVIDLLFHIPSYVKERLINPRIENLFGGEDVTLSCEVLDKQIGVGGRPSKVIVAYHGVKIEIVYFKANSYVKNMIDSNYKEGSKVFVSGKLDKYLGKYQIVHPESIDHNLSNISQFESIYPLTYAINQKILRKIIRQALNYLPNIDDWISNNSLESNNWPSWKKAIENIHIATSSELDENSRRRLSFDELLAYQMAIRLIRKQRNQDIGRPNSFKGLFKSKLLDSIEFDLTNGQKEVIKEIEEDQKSDKRMLRLLQGDVGSGKTIVALIAILNVIESGAQSVFMAPTSILATQHFEWIESLKLGLNVGLLTGKTSLKDKKQILDDLEKGNIDLLVGTHAVFQEKVIYSNLALAVIDEQHRFGVKQRLSLSDKGKNVDVLLMSATPIPRTLALTLYGDLDCSTLKEKPAFRKKIDTRVMPDGKINDLINGLARIIEKKEKIYWICPLIEESEEMDLIALENRFKSIEAVYKKKVAMIHGKMSSEEKDNIMDSFKNSEVDILVATTVIEVGVNVPNATAIIIEHAERYGLAQLHQLRGRVGRSDLQSSCVLLYKTLSHNAKRRLSILKETEDGFKIAEEDLSIRGSGVVIGTQQSGIASFRFARIFEDQDLLELASNKAENFITNSDELTVDKKKKLKNLLYIFQFDRLVNFLLAG